MPGSDGPAGRSWFDRSGRCDVAVLGGGNAGLCAALTAADAPHRSIVIVESAPRALRGGNSRHTRNLRCAHDAPTDLLTDAYAEDEFLADLRRVTEGQTNEPLARQTVRASADCPTWLRQQGVRLQAALRGTLHLGRTNAFFVGGGTALMNTYYALAERRGIRVFYNAEVIGLDLTANGRCDAIDLLVDGVRRTLVAKSVILATGGFEANRDWLEEIWGPAARDFIIRGTPYNTGKVLRLMLDAGARPVGDATQCHAVAVDARSPAVDGGIVTRLDGVSLGIVVNTRAERFYDEGEDFWPKRYAIWGRLIAQQPDRLAFSILDARTIDQFMPPVFPAITAPTIRDLATQLKLSPDRLQETVDRFNDAVVPGGRFDHAMLDDCRTRGLTPDKTHWAQRIDRPPFYAWPLRPGITFTYLGLAVDQRARVLLRDGAPAANVFAAGEIMAGNILGKGYIAGVGMTIGTVFGRIAGFEAGAHADH
jgi:tricarballylate dehydrogenase